MCCISISNYESLIYVQITSEFHNVHFCFTASWKCDFCSFVEYYRVNGFAYPCILIRNICKYHFILIVMSDCYSSNTRILPLTRTCGFCKNFAFVPLPRTRGTCKNFAFVPVPRSVGLVKISPSYHYHARVGLVKISPSYQYHAVWDL